MPHGSEKSSEKNRNEMNSSFAVYARRKGKIVANYEDNDT